jgi:hypothetical protein
VRRLEQFGRGCCVGDTLVGYICGEHAGYFLWGVPIDSRFPTAFTTLAPLRPNPPLRGLAKQLRISVSAAHNFAKTDFRDKPSSNSEQCGHNPHAPYGYECPTAIFATPLPSRRRRRQRKDLSRVDLQPC